jgi:hypothetical protein
MLAPTSGVQGRGEIGAALSWGRSGPDFTPPPITTTSILGDGALHKESERPDGVSSYLPRVGIGTPNIRVRFLRFAVRFRLVFRAFRFLAM